MLPKKILFLAVAPAQLLDVAGPIEVFAQANRLRTMEAVEAGRGASGDGPYEIDLHILGSPEEPNTSAGLRLASSVTRDELEAGFPVDTLVVAGGEGARRDVGGSPASPLIRELAEGARRVVGICTGAFLLAEAGLLGGRRVSTHWRWCAELARRYPDLRVDPEPIYIRDGAVWTSAGIAAGIDLALGLVEDDHGHPLALAIARELVMFLRRPGGQRQFSTLLSAQTSTSARLTDVLAWVADNLSEPISVERLAERVHLSPRQFARSFRAETGQTPGRAVEAIRVEAARRLLERGTEALSVVTASCGFGTEETLRRAFLRHVGVPPAQYRDRFHGDRRRRSTNDLRGDHP
ncbi:GlxA family transcriptional regulator [Salinarimonas soli]|uniref:GlxA family transcriptional regulator n=1 Tax=Salinarimonas soli TaxID=1638099 RepID=A0A5B2VA22_9HYPH|nr:GlxA family transcriptional regulator [Salinarimonas soli]KAA2235656.1 GlxA family transcriptional regulator [Salinarimonas soli]